MTKKELYKKVIEFFLSEMPVAETELEYQTPFQLLVSVVLSAQCTDKRVNIIVKLLFNKYPDSKSLSLATQDEIFKLIKSCSYPNNKAKYLIEISKIIEEKYEGNIPDDINELMKLPGVGRKSANVVAAVLYNKPVIPVDTHVFRVSKRIGLVTDVKTPYEVEQQLEKNIPPYLRPKVHHWLILHGRYICTARNPKCTGCGLNKICLYNLSK
jgi:endonuclease-3